MKTVLIPPICNFDFLMQLPQQIALQFEKHGYNVLYCDENPGINIKKKQVNKNFTIYPNWEYFYYEYTKGMVKVDIIYNTAAKNYKLVDSINSRIKIYHSCDSFEEWKKYEKLILKSSNLVLCTSDFIYDLRKTQHNNVHLCKNGCNEDMIDLNYTNIENLKFVKRPICVFSGALGVWVSTYHLRNVAKEFFTYVVGIELGKQMPKNVNHQKALGHNSLMNFLHNMDIGLLPFNIKSEITQAANPIKLWEYLGCGLPVVATDWRETNNKELKDVVFTSSKDNDFIKNIEKISDMSKSDRLELKEECFKIARKNTWEKRFEIIQREIDNLYS